MAKKGKTQLLITWVASPDKVAEMDRLVESHGSWMAKTHDREGRTHSWVTTSPRVPSWRTRSTRAPRALATLATSLVRSTIRQRGSRITGAKPRSLGVTSARWWECSEAATRRRCMVAPSPNPSGRRRRLV